MEKGTGRPAPTVLEGGQALADDLDAIYRIDRLRRLSAQTRLLLLEMIYRAGSGHVGSSLSCADIISVLKFDQMDWQASRPRTESDVFVLSKGHAVPAWYAALIVDGEVDPTYVSALRRIDSPFQGHPDRCRFDLVDVSTGALGQGLSVALGRAEAKRLKRQDTWVYCIVGDGEMQEGQIWEAVMYAGIRAVANLIVFIDYNKSQSDGPLKDVLPLDGLTEKLGSFLWHVQEIDGHSHAEIRNAVIRAKENRHQPSVIIAHTRKGYLGDDRILLDGAHSGTLSAQDFEEAVRYLGGLV